MTNSKKLKKLVMLIGDIAVLNFALYLALSARSLEFVSAQVWQRHFEPFIFIFIAWILVLYITGLYSLRLAASNIRFFSSTGQSFFIAAIISVAYFYLNPTLAIAPKTILALFILILIILFSGWRLFFNWLLRSRLPKNNIAIIGLNSQVEELVREIQSKPHLGYQVAFVVDDIGKEILALNDVPLVRGITDLKKLIADKAVSTIVLASTPHQSPELRDILFSCLELKINYVNLANFYETITGRVPIEAINQMWFLENLSEGSKTWFSLFKRTYDLCLALLVLAVTLPFWPLISLIIKLESKGPVFFTQDRAGKKGNLFKIIKFRSMTVEGNDFSPTDKEYDRRVTRFGSLLRKSRVDEIPQILNVLKGEMSFVGPRPERPEFIAELEQTIPFYKERMLAKPGLTGWDQISGEYHSPSYEDSFKKLQYDLFYIKNRSIYLDLSIILKTLAIMLSRKGL